ncbi:HlyD family secretion protein [Flavobacterium aquidurense]|uniref:Efflux transporter periplasmic adaptor subunit n=1 Tax=Flavobacterium frigidimaris TaxID=262320 RepID=A0ABX4BSI6_FLAFR|nr:efflux RND transporter periplasmic adaptor subunit [Flavobacterium frigidimaris]OXA79687.1 efflux transporter periplasmic adaptor subunit [Flavobacterium frigidimaris]SDZ17343.1 HlyD family secretion protein [Flavobacterium aquidurense]
MKKGVTVTILIFIAIVFFGALYYLYAKNQESPIVFKTEKAEIKTIVKTTIATGNIQPDEEVLIKPNISGIIEEVYIKAGEKIKAGDMIAKIRVVANVSNVSSTQNQVQTAKIALDNQEKIYKRQKTLFEKEVISANDFDAAQLAYTQAKQNYLAARQSLDIVKTGTTTSLGSYANTLIRSTVNGMVLAVPVKVGNQVIESNNFNEGTTIASVADVGRMIFIGKIDESEVGKIKVQMPIEITVGAIENKKFDAILTDIAPKGVVENGAIQFEIKASLENRDATFIRAGLSANASIILEKADKTLAIKESLVQFDKKTQKPYVEIETAPQKFQRKDLILGVSDGIYVQVKSGIKDSDKIKIWNQGLISEGEEKK